MAAQNLFDPAALGAAAGATAIVLAFTNTFRILTKIRSLLVPFLFSVATALTGAYVAEKLKTGPDWFIALANSCLLFLTATGAQETVADAAAPKEDRKMRRQSRQPLKFLSSWLRD